MRQSRPASLPSTWLRCARGLLPRCELKGVTQINVLDTLGLISTSFGDWQGRPGGEHVELTDWQPGRHLSLQFNGDVLVGCNSVGWTEHVGVMRGLVEGQVQAGRLESRCSQNDPTKLMEAYLGAAQGPAGLGRCRGHAPTLAAAAHENHLQALRLAHRLFCRRQARTSNHDGA